MGHIGSGPHDRGPNQAPKESGGEKNRKGKKERGKKGDEEKVEKGYIAYQLFCNNRTLVP